MANVDVYAATNITGRLVKSGNDHVFGYHQEAVEALSLKSKGQSRDSDPLIFL